MTPVGAGRDDPFRSAPLRFPEPPPPSDPWLAPQRLHRLRHAVMIGGTAVMIQSMLVPISPVLMYRIGSCGDAPRVPGEMCSRSCITPVLRDPAADLRLGVMLALLVAFAGFLIGHSHWLFRPDPRQPDITLWVRRGALGALTYAAVGFLVTGLWAPHWFGRPVLTPIFLALGVVTVVTRPQ